MNIKPLSEYPQHALSDENTRFLMSMVIIEQEKSLPEGFVDAVNKSPMSQILLKRAEFHNFGLTHPAAAVIDVMSEGNPGRAIQMLHACAVNTKVGGSVNTETFCMTFERGLPSDFDFLAAWDAQKDARGQNLLDVTQWELRP